MLASANSLDQSDLEDTIEDEEGAKKVNGTTINSARYFEIQAEKLSIGQNMR